MTVVIIPLITSLQLLPLGNGSLDVEGTPWRLQKGLNIRPLFQRNSIALVFVGLVFVVVVV